MFYEKLVKALYGLLKSALLFYKKLLGELKEMGFEVKFDDTCIAENTVNGTHMTACWHDDNLKVSHKDPMWVNFPHHGHGKNVR